MEYRELTDKEVAAYGEIFSSCDVDGTGKVSGAKASELFFASGLPKPALHQITELCGAKRLGHFGRSQFYVALRLIALGQAGLPITLENLQQHGGKLSLPRFDYRNEEYTIRPETTEKRRPSGSSIGLPPPPNKEHVRRTSGQNILLDPQIIFGRRSLHRQNGYQPIASRIPGATNGSDSAPPVPPPKAKTGTVLTAPSMPPVHEPVAISDHGSNVPKVAHDAPCQPPKKIDMEAGDGSQDHEEPTPTSAEAPSGLTVPSGTTEWAQFSDADEDRGLLTGGRVATVARSQTTGHADWTQFSETESGAGVWRGGGRRRIKSGKATVSQSSSTPSSSESDDDESDDGTENGTDVDEAVWSITEESRSYYEQQFLKLQHDPRRHVGGSTAKDFFELSKLPPSELSKIWELSDVDRDGQLNLQEFCIAMHLVVLRRNNVPIPDKLPACLAPYSMLENSNDDPFAPDLISTDDQPAGFWPQSVHTSQPTSSSSSIHNFQAASTSGSTSISGGATLESSGTRRAAPPPPAPGVIQKLESSSSDISTPSEKLINFDLKPLDPNMPHPVPKKPVPVVGVAAVDASSRPRPAPRAAQHITNSSEEDAAPPPPPRARGTSQPPPPPLPPMVPSSNSGEDELHDRRPQTSRMGSHPPISSSHFPGNALDGHMNVATVSTNREPVLPANAPISSARDRKDLLMAIRAVKEKNHSLVRLNNELNYELKEIQEQRIGLEIQLEHLRPFHG